MPKQPLAEVFGFPTDNLTPEAERYRRNRLCPFNNRVPNCTKDRAKDPLGVCSVREGAHIAVTCPIRFRQSWSITEHAAEFFFPANMRWTSLTEVRLNDRNGRCAGNIDLVLVAYDDRGRVTDFGALEVQAVYISGNIRRPFEYYMQDPTARHAMEWVDEMYYPRPDYLSSSRKRLAPQLIYKGGILNAWGKKLAIAVDKAFFDRLPLLPETDPATADVVWMVYELVLDEQRQQYVLTRRQQVYTAFAPVLQRLTTPEAGPVEQFVSHLQAKLDEKLENGYPPDAPILTETIEE